MFLDSSIPKQDTYVAVIAPVVSVVVVIIIAIIVVVIVKRRRKQKSRLRSDIEPIIRHGSDTNIQSVFVQRFQNPFDDDQVDPEWEVCVTDILY